MPETAEQKVTLYDLSNALLEAMDTIAQAEAEGDELTEEQQKELLDAITTEIKGKTDRFCHHIHVRESQITLAEEEIKRLTARKKSLEGEIDRLGYYAHRILTEVLHTEKIVGETNTIQLRKLPDMVQILNRSAVPEEYREVLPAEIRVNLNAIKAAMKAGKSVAGAILISDRAKAEFK